MYMYMTHVHVPTTALTNLMTDLFDFPTQSNHFAVMGSPVAHSQSPQIHQLFAQQFDIRLQYDRIQVDAGGFNQAVSHFAAHGGAGLNVTAPFKRDAWQLCAQPSNHLSARAQRAQAVNTLRFDVGRLDQDGLSHGLSHVRQVFGDNTDGVGLVRDIQNNLGIEITGKRVLVLGAGGAVRGVLGALVACQPARLTIANRTASKAYALAEKFGTDADTDTDDNNSAHLNINGCGFKRIDEQTFDLVINGTSASLNGELPGIAPHCLGARTLVYDMMYARRPTVFMDWATANGAGKVSDGLGMLVEQAAESFAWWHHQRPDTATVIDALRDA